METKKIVHQFKLAHLHSHTLVALVVTGFLLLQSRAATVVGDLHDGVLGNAVDATLIFRPGLTPLGVGNATYLDITKKTNVVGGVWSMNLVGGLYVVQCVPFGRQVAIIVPINDTNTYQFNTVSDIILMMGNAGTINVSNITANTINVTNIYSFSITNSGPIETTNLFAETILTDYIIVSSNLFFVERVWSGPTNVLSVNAARWYYSAFTPCSITGFTNILTGAVDNSTLLTISNASSTNIQILLPSAARISVGSTNYVTLTNQDLYLFSIQVLNGRTNIVPRSFH